MLIFGYLKGDSNSLIDAESYDVKILTLGTLALKILMDIWNCVGSTYMRGSFFVRICCIAIYKPPVILWCFLVRVFTVLGKNFFCTASYYDLIWTVRCGIFWGIVWCIARNCRSLYKKVLYEKTAPFFGTIKCVLSYW